MWVFNEKKKFIKTNELVNIMVIQSSVLTMILSWNIPFVYPNHDCAQVIQKYWSSLMNVTICTLKQKIQSSLLQYDMKW